MSATNLDWALAYAQELGWRVHPCHWIKPDGYCSCGDPDHVVGKHKSAGKHPILTGWPERATTDPSLIERWWGRTPNANIAVATGPESDLLVLDVDGPEGERNLVDLERRHGPLPEIYPMQWTGSGGGRWQAFFRYPQGRTVGNSAGKLGPALDTRGTRGYAMVAPSVTLQPYEWAADRKPGTVPPDDAPPWLIDLLDPPAQPETGRQDWNSPGRPTEDRYLLRALEAELALVASAPVGRRNDQLNESAFNLFRFAAEGRLHAGAIADGLEAAARHAGLDAREIASTLKSAATKRGVELR